MPNFRSGASSHTRSKEAIKDYLVTLKRFRSNFTKFLLNKRWDNLSKIRIVIAINFDILSRVQRGQLLPMRPAR